MTSKNWYGPVEGWDEIMESNDVWFFMNEDPQAFLAKDAAKHRLLCQSDATFPAVGIRGVHVRGVKHTPPFDRSKKSQDYVRSLLGNHTFLIEVGSKQLILLSGKLDAGPILYNHGRIYCIDWQYYAESGLYAFGMGSKLDANSPTFSAAAMKRFSKVILDPTKQEMAQRFPMDELDEFLVNLLMREMQLAA